jgi:hypothetical protein
MLKKDVGFEILAEVMNVAIFRDIAPCGPYVNRPPATCYTLLSCSADFDPEDSGNKFFRNVGSHMGYTALYPR